MLIKRRVSRDGVSRSFRIIGLEVMFYGYIGKGEGVVDSGSRIRFIWISKEGRFNFLSG